MTEKQEDYKASSISVLKGLDAVRKRPGMYIGDTSDGSGLHHMPSEIIDNSVDEAQAGFATIVEVIINKDDSVTVIDDGRGIPVDIHKEEKISAAELVLTKLHAGGKFNQNSYKVSGGLHGVGAAVVNALSEWMKVTIERDGGVYEINFTRGNADAPLARVGDSDKHGTKITYLADKKIFGDISLNGEVIYKRIQELACLNPGIRFIYTDNRPETPIHYDWTYHNGVSDLVKLFSRGEKAIFQEPIRFTGEKEITVKDPTGETHQGVSIVDISMNWLTNNNSSNIYAYTNNIGQKEGGTHVQGARIALSNAFRAFIQKTKAGKRKLPDITVDDLSEGIVLVVSIKIPEPSFSSQTKEKLTSPEAQRVVGLVTSENIQEWIDRNPSNAKEIVDRIVEAAEARIAAKEASKRSREIKQQKTGLDVACIPGKLSDCESNNPKECEIFIVEGDSAGGTAKQGRDQRIQALLPLKGKILNTESLKNSQILKSAEVGTMIKAFGFGGIGSNFNIDGLRYHKIIIMTDADVDGSHIQTLLLTFFFRHTPELIRRGHIYIAQPPLYSIKRGKKVDYILNDDTFEEFLINNLIEKGYGYSWMNNNEEIQCFDDSFKELINCFYKLNKVFSSYLRTQQNKSLLENFICANLAYEDSFLPENIVETTELFKKHISIAEPDVIWNIEDINKDDGSFVIVSRKRGVLKHTKISKDMLENPLLKRIINSEDFENIAFFQDFANFNIINKDGNIKIPVKNITKFLNIIDTHGRIGIEHIGRFKGLGEMNASELWDTTLNPETRSLLQVTINDCEEANIVFNDLMGKNPHSRKVRFLSNMGITIDDEEDDLLEDNEEENADLNS